MERWGRAVLRGRRENTRGLRERQPGAEASGCVRTSPALQVHVQLMEMLQGADRLTNI